MSGVAPWKATKVGVSALSLSAAAAVAPPEPGRGVLGVLHAARRSPLATAAAVSPTRPRKPRRLVVAPAEVCVTARSLPLGLRGVGERVSGGRISSSFDQTN